MKETEPSSSRVRSYYQLKADLVDVELNQTKLVLTFEKRNDPAFSAKRLEQLKGFIVASFKKPKGQPQARLDGYPS